MKKAIFFVYVLCSITAPVSGQKIATIIDSLHNELTIAKEDTTRSLLMAELSYRYYTIPDSAFNLASRGLALAKAIGYERGIAANQFSLGNYYSNVGDHLRTTEYLHKALEWYRIHGTAYDQARSYLILGYISNDQLGYGNATAHFKKALHFYEIAENSHDIVLVLNNLGVVYTTMKKYDSAIFFLNKGLALARQNKAREFEAVILGSIGELYLDKKDYPNAEHYLAISTELNKDFDPRIQSINYFKLASIYKATNRINRAISNAEMSLRIAQETNDLPQIEQASMILHEIYLEQKNYSKAIEYLKKAFVTHDSIYTIEKTKELQKLATNFEVREKEAQIKILQQESSLQQIGMQLQNNSLKRQRFVLVGMIVVITLLAILIAWYRMMNRIKRELEIERVRNHIAKDLHDDIGSTLSSIRIISKIGSQECTLESANRNFSLIENHSSKMLGTMADIVWSINPNNDTMEKIVLYMKEFAAEILEQQNINYHFELSGGLENLKVNVTVRKNLFLIFKEAINNAAKYSGCTEITINIAYAMGILTLDIRDNGAGFDFRQVKLGNGLNNMKERANLIKGRLEIASEPEKGTHINISAAIT
jgi:two-component system, NarL family, sensor histidine kinase UhpB